MGGVNMPTFMIRDMDFLNKRSYDTAYKIKQEVLLGTNKDKERFDLEKYIELIKSEHGSSEDDYIIIY